MLTSSIVDIVEEPREFAADAAPADLGGVR